MPPPRALEDYLELTAAIEATAELLNQPSCSRAAAPSDPRLSQFRHPDPGVVEVNIHPAASWDQLVDQTTHLYRRPVNHG